MKTLLHKLLKGRITRWGFQTRKFVLLGLIAAGVFAGALLTQAQDMVPYNGKTIGQMVIDPASGAVLAIAETGNGTHLGRFTVTGAIDKGSGNFLMTATAANGDNLFLMVVGLSGNTVEMEILDGTGQFNGAMDHLTATTMVDPIPVSLDPLIVAYTATAFTPL